MTTHDSLLHPDDPGGLGRWNYRNVLSISGGKDSTAMYLMAVEDGVDFEAVFCDVGNELPPTYDYVRALPGKVGGPPIQWVSADFRGDFEARRANVRKKWGAEGIDPDIIEKAVANLNPTGNSFLDLCLLRGGFPSSHARFCTDYLKVRPTRLQIYRPLWDQGFVPRSWMGLRREESLARSNLGMTASWKFNKSDPATLVYRPLIDWTLADVWEMHRRHDVDPNPLYLDGATRVGCGPCIFARKSEVRMISSRFPEAIARIREWERLVALIAKRWPAVATFFPAVDIPGLAGPITTKTHGIDAKVDWSKTSWGGKQYNLFEESEIIGSCAHIGLCE